MLLLPGAEASPSNEPFASWTDCSHAVAAVIAAVTSVEVSPDSQQRQDDEGGGVGRDTGSVGGARCRVEVEAEVAGRALLVQEGLGSSGRLAGVRGGERLGGEGLADGVGVVRRRRCRRRSPRRDP